MFDLFSLIGFCAICVLVAPPAGYKESINTSLSLNPVQEWNTGAEWESADVRMRRDSLQMELFIRILRVDGDITHQGQIRAWLQRQKAACYCKAPTHSCFTLTDVFTLRWGKCKWMKKKQNSGDMMKTEQGLIISPFLDSPYQLKKSSLKDGSKTNHLKIKVIKCVI